MHYNTAILCRRLFGKYILPKAEHLKARIKEIGEGAFEEELKKMMKLNKSELQKLYEERDMESV